MKNTLFTKYTVFHVVTGKNSPYVISVLCLKTEVNVQTVLQERNSTLFFLMSVLNILTLFIKWSDKACAFKKRE